MGEVLLDRELRTRYAWFSLHDNDDRYGGTPYEGEPQEVIETMDGVCVLLGDLDSEDEVPVRVRVLPGAGRRRGRPGVREDPVPVWHRAGGRGRFPLEAARVRARRARAGARPAVPGHGGEPSRRDRGARGAGAGPERAAAGHGAATAARVEAASARLSALTRVGGMEFRNLGNSGLKVSAIAYGNWLTHGSQVEEDAALACVPPGPRRGDHDLRHRRHLRQHQGGDGARQGPEGRAPRGPGDLHQGLLADRTRRAQRPRACRASTSSEAINGSLKRLGTDYVDLYQAHRYDYETPLEETMEAFADVVRSGQGALHRRLGVAGRGDPARRTRWPAS